MKWYFTVKYAVNDCRPLFYGQPREEKTVWFYVLPVRNEAAGNLMAIAAEEPFDFGTGEPFLPFGSFEPAPVFGVLINNDYPAARLHNPAYFVYRPVDFHGVFQGFCGVGAIEIPVFEGKLGHGAGAGVNAGRDMAEHFRRDVQAPDFGFGFLLVEDAGEAAFAAADVEDAAAAEISQVVADELDVIDAWVDGGREMLLVRGGGIEGRLDAGAELGGEVGAF